MTLLATADYETTTMRILHILLFMFWIIKEELLFYFISALNLMFKWKNPILEEK